MDRVEGVLPSIPAKRYFTIGEVSELCLVKPYVLRYWEQEFVQLKPMKRRENRRYYQHHEVLLIRRIRELLYEQGFTISGARNQLAELGVVTPAGDELDALVDEPLLVPARGAQHLPQVAHAGFNAQAGFGGGSSVGMPDGRVARALQASAPAMIDAAWMVPALPDLEKLSPDSVMALREALLSIRDLLS